jgi:hypothetical protein
MDKLLKYLTKLEELEALEGGGNEEKKQLYISKINYYYDLVGGEWYKPWTWKWKLPTRRREELVNQVMFEIKLYDVRKQNNYNEILKELKKNKWDIIDKNIDILKDELLKLKTIFNNKSKNKHEKLILKYIKKLKNSENKLRIELCKLNNTQNKLNCSNLNDKNLNDKNLSEFKLILIDNIKEDFVNDENNKIHLVEINNSACYLIQNIKKAIRILEQYSHLIPTSLPTSPPVPPPVPTPTSLPTSPPVLPLVPPPVPLSAPPPLPPRTYKRTEDSTTNIANVFNKEWKKISDIVSNLKYIMNFYNKQNSDTNYEILHILTKIIIIDKIIIIMLNLPQNSTKDKELYEKYRKITTIRRLGNILDEDNKDIKEIDAEYKKVTYNSFFKILGNIDDLYTQFRNNEYLRYFLKTLFYEITISYNVLNKDTSLKDVVYRIFIVLKEIDREKLLLDTDVQSSN